MKLTLGPGSVPFILDIEECTALMSRPRSHAQDYSGLRRWRNRGPEHSKMMLLAQYVEMGQKAMLRV